MAKCCVEITHGVKSDINRGTGLTDKVYERKNIQAAAML